MFLGAEVYVPGNAYQIQADNGYCMVGLETLSTVSEIILGDIFFRGYTITFDMANQRIGFYGNFKLVNIIDPKYFILIQYISCGFGVVLALFGVVVWLYGVLNYEKMFKSTLTI
jgi:hypothetical protein